MKKNVFLPILLCALLMASESFAINLPQYVWDPGTSQFLRSSNMAPVWSPSGSDFLAPKYPSPSTSVQLLKEIPTGNSALRLLGDTASTALTVRGATAMLGKLSPILTAVSLVMTVEEIYQFANASPANKALFDGQIPQDPPVDPNTPDGSIINVPGSYGGRYTTVHRSSYTTGNGQFTAGQVATYCSVYSGTICKEVTSHSNLDSSHFAAAVFSLASAPPAVAPNAADGDLNWWFHEVQRNVAAPESSKPYPSMTTGVDAALSQKLSTNPSAAGLTYPSLAEMGYAGSQADADGTAAKADTAVAASDTATASALQTLADNLAKLQAAQTSGNATQAQVDAAKAALDVAAAQKAQTDAAKAKADADAAVPMPLSTPDPPHALNWEPLKSLKGILTTTFPFNLLGNVVTTMGVLVQSTPVAPSFSLPMPFNNVIVVDLAVFDPVASVARWVGGILLTIGALLGINNFWRGVS